MFEIVINENICCGSAKCIEVCTDGAISLKNGKAFVDNDKCTLDGICIPACPNGAIDFEDDYSGVGCGF